MDDGHAEAPSGADARGERGADRRGSRRRRADRGRRSAPAALTAAPVSAGRARRRARRRGDLRRRRVAHRDARPCRRGVRGEHVVRSSLVVIAAPSTARIVSPAITPAAAAGPFGSTSLIVSEPVGSALSWTPSHAGDGRRRRPSQSTALRSVRDVDGDQLRAGAAVRAQTDELAAGVDDRRALGDVDRRPSPAAARRRRRRCTRARRRRGAEQRDHVAVAAALPRPRTGRPRRRVGGQHGEAVDGHRHRRLGRRTVGVRRA